LIKRVHDVAQEMESIGYLNGVRCAQTHSISDPKTAVTRDDLGTRMVSKPRRQGCRLIVRQNIDRPPNCQVDQQQAITQRPSVQCEIIDTQLCRRGTDTERLVAQKTAQGIWTGRQTRGSRNSGAGFAASSLSKRQK
jgi:hypothetical protein